MAVLDVNPPSVYAFQWRQMTSFLIRIEGCNFRTTLYDTDDLSTIRGASRAYLDITEYWERPLSQFGGAELIVRGASDALYRLTMDDGVVREELDRKIGGMVRRPDPDGGTLGALIPHLTFVWSVAEESDNYESDLLRLSAHCSERRLRTFNVDVPVSIGQPRPCSIDRVRPVGVVGYKTARGTQDVSKSVQLRREYGRAARQGFYEKELCEEPRFGFTNDFPALASEVKGLNPSICSKAAVIYFDGNKFTALRNKAIFGDSRDKNDSRQAHRAFSDALREARRKMLRVLLAECERFEDAMFVYDGDGEKKLRFETLLWGGDEAMFVLPAWIVLGAIGRIAEAFEGPEWRHRGMRLSHSMGVVICNHNTPIAVTRKLASEIADGAKPLAMKDRSLEDQENIFSLQVLESVEPPQENLKDFREKLYGTGNPQAFALTGSAEVRQFHELLDRFQAVEGGLPRSQLFRMIVEARTQQLFRPGKSAEALKFKEEVCAKAFKHCGCGLFDELRSSVLGCTQEAPLLPLIRLAEFWDYAAAFSKLGGAARC
jgi:hypothetical protein